MQNLNVITTIQEIYEKEVKSPNITNINKISIEDSAIIERVYDQEVRDKYKKGEITLHKYDFKEVNFNTRLDIKSDTDIGDKVISGVKDIEGNKPEVKERTVNVMVTKTEYYGGSVTIKYLTEEEKEKKIEEIEEKFMDRYCYSDYDLDDELQYLDKCEVDVDVVRDDYYDDVADIVCENYEEEFGDESLEERRDSIYVYIVSKKENYLRKVVHNPNMIPYAEYIFETENTVILIESQIDFNLLNKYYNNILSIEKEGEEEGFFKIIFNNFY